MKVTKYILLLSILINSVCSETYAQHTFLKYLRYGNPESNCHGWSVQEAKDGNIVVQFRYFDNFSSGIDFGFFILNKIGDSLNTKDYHLDGDDFLEPMFLDEDYLVYMAGSRMAVGSSFYDGVLYKIDLLDSFNNQYYYYSNPDGNYSLRGILKNKNSLYLAGSKKNATTSLNFNLQKTDLNGIIKFDSSYVSPLADFPYTSNFDDENNILMSGGSFTGSTDQARVMAMKVDTNGNEKWRTFVGIENDSLFNCRSIGNGIVQATNGAYYIAGVTDNWCDSNLETRGRNHSLLIKLDSNGNHMWTKKERYSDYWTQSYSQIFNSFDGNIICIGNVTSIVDSTTLLRNYDILVTKYDLNGNLIWNRKYGQVNYHEYVYNSTQTKNGGFILTGRYENLYNPFHDVQTYILKLDDCGCLVPNCDPNCIASGITESKKQHEMKVYPNPATNKLSIESKQVINNYIIYNLLGEKQLEGRYRDSIDISMLSNGMYLIQIENTTTFSTIKFIKE